MKSTKRNPEPARAPTPQASTPQGVPWWLPAALAVAALVAYLPALRGPFLFDDLSLPMMNGTNLSVMFYVRRVARVITNLSLVLDQKLWGANPEPYHVLNLVFHGVNALLVFYILRRLAEFAGRSERARDVAAVFGAGVFLLHPLQTEAVSYIASRSEVLSVFFGFSAYALFLRCRCEVKGWIRALALLLLVGLAVVSKESALAIAALFLLTDYMFNPGFSLKGAAGNWRLYVPMLAAGAFGGLYLYRLGSREGTAGSGLSTTPIDYLFTQFKAIWIYVRLFAIPFGQNLDHGFPVTKAPGDALSWLGLLGLLCAMAAAWVYRKRLPLLAFGVFAFLILLSPTSSVVPIEDTLVERRVYLASLALIVILAEFVSRMDLGVKQKFGLGALLLCLTVLTMNRNGVYTSAEAMWMDAVRGNPTNARAQFQLGYAYYSQGRCAEAVKRYEEAARLQKPDYRLLVDWGLACDCAGNLDAAAARLLEATKLERNSHAWAMLGMVYGKRGRYDDAVGSLNEALRLNPNNEMALVYMGNVLTMTGQYAGAIADYERALQLNPSNESAISGMAQARRLAGGAR